MSQAHAIAGHARALLASSGRRVTYRRGSSSVEVIAAVGRTPFRLDSGTGAGILSRSRDYLIRAEDLVLDGEQTEPARGDRIEETVGEATYTHEVMSPTRDEPDWRWADSERLILRVHTKEVQVQ